MLAVPRKKIAVQALMLAVACMEPEKKEYVHRMPAETVMVNAQATRGERFREAILERMAPMAYPTAASNANKLPSKSALEWAPEDHVFWIVPPNATTTPANPTTKASHFFRDQSSSGNRNRLNSKVRRGTPPIIIAEFWLDVRCPLTPRLMNGSI